MKKTLKNEIWSFNKYLFAAINIFLPDALNPKVLNHVPLTELRDKFINHISVLNISKQVSNSLERTEKFFIIV